MGIRESGTVFIDGTPDAMNAETLYREGDLGQVFPWDKERKYQVVKLSPDSAVTPAADQVLLWKDLDDYVVTNDVSEAISRNHVAGVLRNAATVGRYVCALRKGKSITVDIDSASPSKGDAIVASANDGKGAVVAIGTAPTHLTLGIAAASGTTVTEIAVDVDVAFDNV